MSDADGILKRMAILIAAGEWVPGEQLPDQRELMASWRISEAIASDAVTLLKTAGLAVSGPGAAIVVAPEGRRIAGQMLRDGNCD
jgi:DNA-binding FadR family transcriptional regulator